MSAKKQAAPKVAEVAKLRKGGAKWDEVREKTGVPWDDTRFRTLLRAAGYAPSGIKGGDGLEIKRRVKPATKPKPAAKAKPRTKKEA